MAEFRFGSLSSGDSSLSLRVPVYVRFCAVTEGFGTRRGGNQSPSAPTSPYSRNELLSPAPASHGILLARRLAGEKLLSPQTRGADAARTPTAGNTVRRVCLSPFPSNSWRDDSPRHVALLMRGTCCIGPLLEREPHGTRLQEVRLPAKSGSRGSRSWYSNGDHESAGVTGKTASALGALTVLL